jgi:hypothetical protein
MTVQKWEQTHQSTRGCPPKQHYEHHFQSSPSLPYFHMVNITKGVLNSSHRRTIMEIPILKKKGALGIWSSAYGSIDGILEIETLDSMLMFMVLWHVFGSRSYGRPLHKGL